MRDKASEERQQPLAKRKDAWKLAYRYARRVVTRAFGIVGVIANVLAIYSFGEDRHWWGFNFAVSPKTKEVFWMLAVGLGGPWAMMLGGIAGAKFSERFTGDRIVTALITRSVVRVSMFFAIFHCAQMSFDIKIFPRYLSSEGFFKIAGIYLLLGLAIGVVFGFMAHMVSRRFGPSALMKKEPQP